MERSGQAGIYYCVIGGCAPNHVLAVVEPVETIALALGSQLLQHRVVSAMITSSPRVPILEQLLGLKRLGNTDGATLSIGCSNASVSLACSWTAL